MCALSAMSFSVRTTVFTCILSVCLGYPTYYIAAPNPMLQAGVKQPETKPTCTEHPTTNYGPHGVPVPDTTSKLELTPQTAVPNAKAGTTTLCLGKSYDLKVIYGGASSRQSLLTTTAGMLQPSVASLNDSSCAGKRFIPRTEPPSKTLNFTTALYIPCNTTDKALTLGMTSIQTKSGNFQTLINNYTIEACETTCMDVQPKWPQSLTLGPANAPVSAPASPPPKSAAPALKGASSLAAALLSAAAAVLAAV